MTRRRPSEIELSMFPFLSVLCVVIGILMLFMIVIIGTRVIGAEAEELVVYRMPRDFGLDDASEDQAPGIPEEQHRALSDTIRRLTTHLIHQQKLYGVLRQQHAQLEDLIEIKRDELAQIEGFDPAAPVVHGPIGEQEKVKVVPDRRRKVLKKAILVEVTAEGYVVHPEETKYATEELDQNDSPLQRFIKNVDGRRDKQYLLLLLHPSGVKAYEKLDEYLKKTYKKTVKFDIIPGLVWKEVEVSRIDLGVEPFSPYWRLIAEGQ